MKAKLKKMWRTVETRNRIVGTILGLLVGVAIGLCFHQKAAQLPLASTINDYMKGLEYRTYDLRFRLRGPLDKKDVSQDIILLDIDDESWEWQSWPFDRLLYAEVIRALGAEGANAKAYFFDVFFFDPSGPRLNPGVADIFSRKFSLLSDTIANDQEMIGEMKMQLYEISETLRQPIGADILQQVKGRLGAIVSNDQFKLNMEQMKDVGLFLFENSDLSGLAPDRDAVLSDAINKAGNVFLAQVVSKLEPTPYSLDDILYNPFVHAIFAKFIQMADRTQTENLSEVAVNYTIRNLTVKDYEKILEISGKPPVTGEKNALPFTNDERKAIEEELEDVRKDTEKGLAINYKYGADIRPDNPVPKADVLASYIDIVSMQTVMPMFGDHAAGVGYVMPELWKDGIIRAMAPGVVFDERFYFHIDMLVVKHYLGVKNEDMDFYEDKIVLNNCRLPGQDKPFTITIPFYEKGKMLVNWAGTFLQPDTLVHRSFRKIYEASKIYNVVKKNERGEILNAYEQEIFNALTPEDIKKATEEIEFFKGKIAMMGLTASETHDLNPVPFHPRYPLVGMHANAANTIINQIFIHVVPFWISFGVLVAISTVIGFVGGAAKQSISGGVTGGAVIGYGVVAFLLLSISRYWIPFVPVALAIVLSYLMIVIYRYMTEGKEAKKMKGMFSTYVNPEVVDTLIHNPEKLRLGGEKMDLTAMFSMASGPGLSDAESPEELVDRLNEYFTVMTEHIFGNQGMLDKYEGAIIMAVYGAPIHYEDNAVKACFAALDMQKATLELHKKWAGEGKKPIFTNVGLNSGMMIAGNMGSESRFNYTIMGDAVNLSARLLGANKQYGSGIMISEFTYEKAKEKIIVRMLDKIRVVGKLEPVKVYELLGKAEEGLPPDLDECARLFREGYALYLETKWDEAKAKFEEGLKAIPGDGPSKVYIARCEDYKAEPPPLGEDGKWDGVYVMTKK